MKLLKSINISLFIVLMALSYAIVSLAQTQETTFNFTGAQQSFVVPQGVFRIMIRAWGAQGANANSQQFGTGLGGLGGYAQGELEVTPGQMLEIFVGGQGATLDDFNAGGGGFNGGGSGQSDFGFQVGGGGGASDIRVGGTSLNDRVIVAAGGGGACRGNILFGGHGGGLTGGRGDVVLGGLGGTQTAGGTGYLSTDNPPVCLDGQFGSGGDGTMNQGFCGGGGGGWYGGGAGCGAGGGSSYIDGVENGSTLGGARSGDGLVTLRYSLIDIDLSPDTAVNDVLTDHTVTATVLSGVVPQEGVLLKFEVITGPNMGLMSDPGSGECVPIDCTTDLNGEVSWTYTGSKYTGTDTIIASYNTDNILIESDIVEKTWVLPPRHVPTLSEWGLIALSALFGIVGLMFLRRRWVVS